jgi:hypothetical protein
MSGREDLGERLLRSLSVWRAREVLQVIGVFMAATGLMSLPFPLTSPTGFTQSLFERLASDGAFLRQGVILLAIGVGFLAVAAWLPSDRQ